jgi:uncharacterized protein YprB with RNaseH-like and TPR domain/predicted nuclease with RNAse H fold
MKPVSTSKRHSSIIKRTFAHLTSIGEMKERLLWESGIETWEDLMETLSSCRNSSDLFQNLRKKQETLFTESKIPSDGLAKSWMEQLEKSFEAYRMGDLSFFTSLLNPSDHWRVLQDYLDDALFLDIETTGLSKELHYITVIGALWHGNIYQWVWPENIEDFKKLMLKCSLVVTFNGQRFDLPFLRAHFPNFPNPRAHVDLLYIARKAGFKGSQKEVEKLLGFSRKDDIEGITGFEATVLWSRAVYGSYKAYRTLLRYNRTDLEMLPKISYILCKSLYNQLPLKQSWCTKKINSTTIIKRHAQGFPQVKKAWDNRKPTFLALKPTFLKEAQKIPVVVGIDLRGNPKNPTGFAVCEGTKVRTKILYKDSEIIEATLASKPILVSIDAPLSLPRGRKSAFDDSPCRVEGGIVRDAERILWARRIQVYPALIQHMQGLTNRGIQLTKKLQDLGLEVIESYPGAAQDILGIHRKRLDKSLLRDGLCQFGFEIAGQPSHDELDAITSAMVGYFYLANAYEPIGADDEGYMIIPRWSQLIVWNPATNSFV